MQYGCGKDYLRLAVAVYIRHGWSAEPIGGFIEDVLS